MSAFFDSLLRRIKFSRQAGRPAAPRPRVRLCLEALDDRILPSAGPFIHRIDIDATPDAIQAGQSALAANLRSAMDFLPILPTPNLVGPMGKGSTVDLGLGTLTIKTESWNSQTGVMDFTGTYESHPSTKILLGSIAVNDDIGPIPVTGHINAPPASTWSNGSVAGIPVSYFTTGISFHGDGHGFVGSTASPDCQHVDFSGSVLTSWLSNGPFQFQYWMSGSSMDALKITDTVTVSDLMKITDVTAAPVPGTSFAGMNWAPITFF